jgi:hypothetical protein
VWLISQLLVRRRGSHAVARPVASRSGSPAEGVHGSRARRNSERLLSRTCSCWSAGAARPPKQHMAPCPLACRRSLAGAARRGCWPAVTRSLEVQGWSEMGTKWDVRVRAFRRDGLIPHPEEIFLLAHLDPLILEDLKST